MDDGYYNYIIYLSRRYYGLKEKEEKEKKKKGNFE